MDVTGVVRETEADVAGFKATTVATRYGVHVTITADNVDMRWQPDVVRDMVARALQDVEALRRGQKPEPEGRYFEIVHVEGNR